MDPKDEFGRAIAFGDTATMARLIAEGLDVNDPPVIVGPGSAMADYGMAATPGENEAVFRVLWAAGHRPSSVWQERIYARFAAGAPVGTVLSGGKKVKPVVSFDTDGAFRLQDVPVRAVLLKDAGDERELVVEFAPFGLGQEVVVAKIESDGLDLGGPLAGLEGRTFDREDAACANASIYLRNAHHPVDVRELRFGKRTRRVKIELTIDLWIDFESEGSGLASQALVWRGEATRKA